MVKQEFEYITEQSGSEQPKKLVFLFHGYGFNASAMQKMAGRLVQDNPDIKVIMPHAPEPFRMPDDMEGAALNVPRQLIGEEAVVTEGRQWFDIAGKDLNDYREPLYNLAHNLNAFITQKRDEYGLRDQDIAIMGFSQGGAVAIYTAMLRDTPVAALVAHSTVFLGGDSLKSTMPTLFIYGEADEEFDGAMYKDVVRQLRAYMPSVELQIFPALSHRTSGESRQAASAFINKHL